MGGMMAKIDHSQFNKIKKKQNFGLCLKNNFFSNFTEYYVSRTFYL